MIANSRVARSDWASRYILGPVEEFATIQLLGARIRPAWLVWIALVLTLGAAGAFVRDWPNLALVMLILSTPLDLIAARLATLQLRPLRSRMVSRIALWPAGGIAMAALGWSEMQRATGWGAIVSAIGAIAFAEAARIEKAGLAIPGDLWLFSRRNAIFAALPFALAGGWTGYLVTMAVYAAVSFYYTQHARHLGVG